MGKKEKKWKESVPYEVVENAINTMPAEKLYPVAKVVCGMDHSVMYFNREDRPQYFQNDQLLRKSLKKCLVAGAFNHRSTIITMLGLGEKH